MQLPFSVLTQRSGKLAVFQGLSTDTIGAQSGFQQMQQNFLVIETEHGHG